ncbi:hypothetical protein [Microbacterium sp.]|uniref:hypothetical protein n=1 Tax=Microbacterium sp. TaxID=51671 RepID=UPI003C766301
MLATLGPSEGILEHSEVFIGLAAQAVQRMLGHASAAMTLDTYAELFEDDLDGVASALDRQRAAALR